MVIPDMPDDVTDIEANKAAREADLLAMANKLGQIIDSELGRTGWSETRLGEPLGLKQSAINSWRTGGRFLGALHLPNILWLNRIFELPENEILVRLGVRLNDAPDFATYIRSRDELTRDQQDLFLNLYRVITS